MKGDNVVTDKIWYKYVLLEWQEQKAYYIYIFVHRQDSQEFNKHHRFLIYVFDFGMTNKETCKTVTKTRRHSV